MVKKSTMVGYDSRSVVSELLRNRSLANVPHGGYTSRLRCNLDLADPTENPSPGDGSGWGKEILFL